MVGPGEKVKEGGEVVGDHFEGELKAFESAGLWEMGDGDAVFFLNEGVRE